MGDNTRNSVNLRRIAMAIDVGRYSGCPEIKLIDKVGLGDNTGNNFETLYLDYL
jgi:hypothetical protein